MIATLIILSLAVSGLTIALVKHGESRGTYNFLVSLVVFIIELTLFYYAGLFDKFFD